MAAASINARGEGKTDPIRNFRFLVNFYPLSGSANAYPWRARATFGFSSVDGLSVAVDTVPVREGGYNATVRNIPLQITYRPVTFQKGVALGSSQQWDWMRWMYRSVQGKPLGLSGLYRSDVEIAVLNHPIPYGGGDSLIGSQYEGLAASDDLVAVRFMLYSAFPGSLTWSSLNAMDNALFVESMSISHEGLDMKWSKDIPAGGWSSAEAFYP